MFRINKLPPSSRYSEDLTMMTVCSSETLAAIYQSRRCYMLQDIQSYSLSVVMLLILFPIFGPSSYTLYR
jgi:hypothetical protein